MSEQKSGFGMMLKFGAILALYSTVVCVGLAFVYDVTGKIIAQRQQADLEMAIKELFPDADGFNPITGVTSPDPAVTIEGDGTYVILKNGETIGVALRTSRAGYAGAIKILVGVAKDNKISGVKILEHKETPGLGANAGSEAYYVDRVKGIHFYSQFAGKSVNDPFIPKEDIIAITASTITSKAVSDSVKAAGLAASVWLGGSR